LSTSYISINQFKAFRLDAVQAFDFYPQTINGQMVDTLRVILSGGDQWYEGPEARSLYVMLLARAREGQDATYWGPG
jgi:hypothetical protein